MPVIGITGGVASGKTTVSRLLTQLLPEARRFSADDEVARLLQEDSRVAQAIRERLGEECMRADGRPDRARLRSRIFRDSEARQTLESILHPAVRAAWEADTFDFRVANRFLLVEIPLLFETGGESLCDVVVVTACSRDIQIARMVRDRALTPEMGGLIVDAQLPTAQKVRRADLLVWNDGSLSALERQICLVAAALQGRTHA